MKNKKLYNNVISILEADLTNVYYKGFEYYDKYIVQNILNFENHFINEKTILSDVYYLLGYIQDLNLASLKALEHYEKSLIYDSENLDSLLAACQNYNEIGKYSKAFELINRVIELESDEEKFHHIKQKIQDNINYEHQSNLSENSIEWRLSELLANRKYEEVIKLSNQNTIDGKTEELLIRNRARGATNKIENYIASWKELFQSEKQIYIDYPDWFYMPNVVKNDLEIWEVFKTNNQKISEDSVFYLLDSFDIHYSEIISMKKMRIEICNFFIAKNSNNTKEISRIKKKYPYWQGYNFME